MNMEASTLRTFVRVGAINGFLAVALGAFGAHALKATLIHHDTVATWQTATQYHLAHALGLLLVALLSEHLRNTKRLATIGWLWTAGIVLFSGSLYVLAVTGIHLLGAVTPLGGLCFLAGWLLLLFSADK